MLGKFFSGIQNDLTPKAERSNPFDSLSTPSSRKPSTASILPSGARTPRAGHAASESGGSNSFFGPHTPGLTTPGAVPVTPGGVSTTGKSMRWAIYITEQGVLYSLTCLYQRKYLLGCCKPIPISIT